MNLDKLEAQLNIKDVEKQIKEEERERRKEVWLYLKNDIILLIKVGLTIATICLIVLIGVK
jgi:hypothetical protein